MTSKLNPVEQIIANNTQKGQFDAEKAEIDLVALRKLYDSLLTKCYERCVSLRYKTAEMHAGESSCVHRCVERYVKSYSIVTKAYDEEYEKQSH